MDSAPFSSRIYDDDVPVRYVKLPEGNITTVQLIHIESSYVRWLSTIYGWFYNYQSVYTTNNIIQYPMNSSYISLIPG